MIAGLVILLISAIAPAQPMPNQTVSSSVVRSLQPRAPRQDFRLRIGRYQWDPLVRPLPPGVSPRQTEYVVVQFRAPLRARARADLRARGLRLDQYVDYLGFIERRSVVDDIGPNLRPLVRAVVPHVPEFKSIDRFDGIGRNVPQAWPLRIVLHQDQNVDVVRDDIRTTLNVRNVVDPEDAPAWALPELRFVPDDPGQVTAVLERNDVRWVEWIRRPQIDSPGSADTAYLQAGTLESWPVWADGLTGSDQHVGVIDFGIPRDDHCFLSTALLSIRNESGSGVGNHATRVSGIVAGDEAENPGGHTARGHAWAARIVYANVIDIGPHDPVGTETFATYLEYAATAGASVHTNSWHLESKDWMVFPDETEVYEYDYTAHQADAFVWNDETQVVLASASNSGEPLGPPAVAFNTLAVGAANYTISAWCDGSEDVTADGRIKPEICAPGNLVETSDKRSECSILSDRKCGSSWATPAVAGAAVLVRQYFLTGRYPGNWTIAETHVPSSALVRAVLVNATSTLPLYNGAYPCPIGGFGTVVLDDALWFETDTRHLLAQDVHGGNGFEETGAVATYAFTVDDASEELRITLAWTSPPGTPPWPASNDLDLVVTTPEGTFMVGNAYGETTSVDTVNKIEMIRVTSPSTGEWTVDVKAADIVNLPEDRRQGYALCVTGGVSAGTDGE